MNGLCEHGDIETLKQLEKGGEMMRDKYVLLCVYVSPEKSLAKCHANRCAIPCWNQGGLPEKS